MNLATYEKKKAKGEIEIRAISKTGGHIYSSFYDTDTAERLDDAAEAVDLDRLENEKQMYLKNSEAEAEKARVIDVIIKDVQAAIKAKYPPEKTDKPAKK